MPEVDRRCANCGFIVSGFELTQLKYRYPFHCPRCGDNRMRPRQPAEQEE